MDYLVLCGCGHGVGQHAAYGCEAAYERRCSCNHTPAKVVDDAVRDVKLYYERAWRTESETE